ncbi:MAG: SRPBCC family protein [Hyphomicrobium sp.]|nr:SRPBCC family protein [Hyphomicrobium sp.]
MLGKIGLVVLTAIAAFLGWVAVQPSSYRVERSAVVAAAPAQVFAHVYDLGKWQAWSPWAKIDPDAKIAFEGPRSGPGAIMRWAGNEKVGRGAMAITEARPVEALTIQLDFVEPFEGTSTTRFAFAPQDQNTRVTWSLDGTQGFAERLIGTLLGLDLEEMIGQDYERGLANLKAVAEAGGPVPPTQPPAAPAPSAEDPG